MLTFIYNKSPENNHLTAITRCLADADSVFICSGHLKARGVKVLADALRKAVARGARIVVYSNQGDGDTEAGAITALKGLGIEHILVEKFFLHTKLYLFEAGERYNVISGSANITEAALTTNEEFSALVTGSKGDDQHRKLAEYTTYLDAKCRAGRGSAPGKPRRKASPKLPANAMTL